MYFEYTSDSDYTSGNNVATSTILEPRGGTIVTTANIGEQMVGNANAASYISNQGNQTAINSPLDVKGLSVYQVYNNGYPTTYGNVLSIGGTGDGQILAGWSGNNNGIERLYYRNRRDMCDTWSDWRTLAFTTDITSVISQTSDPGAGSSLATGTVLLVYA